VPFIIHLDYRWWWIVSFKLWSFYPRIPSTTPQPPPMDRRQGRSQSRAGRSFEEVPLTGNQFFRQITPKFQPNRPAVYPRGLATDRITITVPLITSSRQPWKQMHVCEQVWNHYHFESNVKNLIRVRKKISQRWTSPTNRLVICNANNRKALHGPLHNTTLQRIS